MQKIFIADSSCLILFEKIKELELLHLVFITITPEVAGEFGLPLPSWTVKPLLMKIRQTNFRISHEVETLILKKAGEIESIYWFTTKKAPCICMKAPTKHPKLLDVHDEGEIARCFRGVIFLIKNSPLI
jgi:hypothetical protein